MRSKLLHVALLVAGLLQVTGELTCTIPTVRSAERFAREFDGQKPAVLLAAAVTWPAVANMSWSRLLRDAGHLLLQTGSPHDLAETGALLPTGRIPLREFAAQILQLLHSNHSSNPSCSSAQSGLFGFDQEDFLSTASQLARGLRFRGSIPIKPRRAARHTAYFGLGSTCRGLCWHRHNEAVNVQLLGRKLWFVAPPKLSPKDGTDALLCTSLTTSAYLTAMWASRWISAQPGGCHLRAVRMPSQPGQYNHCMMCLATVTVCFGHATVNLVSTTTVTAIMLCLAAWAIACNRCRGYRVRPLHAVAIGCNRCRGYRLRPLHAVAIELL